MDTERTSTFGAAVLRWRSLRRRCVDVFQEAISITSLATVCRTRSVEMTGPETGNGPDHFTGVSVTG